MAGVMNLSVHGFRVVNRLAVIALTSLLVVDAPPHS
jgi:hypothetical protein